MDYYLHFIDREAETLCNQSLTRYTQAEHWGLPQSHAWEGRTESSCPSGVCRMCVAAPIWPSLTRSVLCLLQAQETAGPRWPALRPGRPSRKPGFQQAAGWSKQQYPDPYMHPGLQQLNSSAQMAPCLP